MARTSAYISTTIEGINIYKKNFEGKNIKRNGNFKQNHD